MFAADSVGGSVGCSLSLLLDMLTPEISNCCHPTRVHCRTTYHYLRGRLTLYQVLNITSLFPLPVWLIHAHTCTCAHVRTHTHAPVVCSAGDWLPDLTHAGYSPHPGASYSFTPDFLTKNRLSAKSVQNLLFFYTHLIYKTPQCQSHYSHCSVGCLVPIT